MIVGHTDIMNRDIMKKQNNIKQVFYNFLKCGVTGWCLEVMFTSVESVMAHDWRMMGRTSLLMFPIYGMGAFLTPVGRMVDQWLAVSPKEVLRPADRIMRHGMLYMVLIFVTEYLTGAWLKSNGMCPWDYTGRHSNISGLIRLDFAPLWFATGLLFEKITTIEEGSFPLFFGNRRSSEEITKKKDA